MRCTRLSLSCEYSAAYSRGLPPDPLPAPASSGLSKNGNRPQRPPLAAGRANQSPLTPRSAKSSPRDATTSTHQQFSKNDPVISPRNSPDPVAMDYEGNYLGPASGVSFMNRVWSRLHQDETSAIPDGPQDESPSKNTSVFMFGDKPYSNYQETGFVLPPFEKALDLVGTYFDFSMVTYRFLHRGSVDAWLRQVYEHNVSFSNLPTGCMVARTSIILMVFAVATLYKEQQPGDPIEGMSESERWYAASKYMSSMESGPPRLETIQARLGQCLYLLSSSRANECWYSYGTALQLVTALGLHRRCLAKLSKNGNSYLEQELRKRIFWSAYTLDKYLSVMFGRPRLLHDEDIDQGLPDEMNDEDMLQEDPARRTGSLDSMMIASVLHYKLGRIIGEISRQLYTINPHSRDPPLETAVRLTSELEKWKETAPPLFSSVRATSLIPPLCRQSQVLQLAYSHAMIHATRSFLLNDFTDLSRRPPVPHPMVTSHVQKCIEAAEDAMTLVDSLAKQGILIQSFWFTHYVCFCAIIVVYIHTIQQHRQSSGQVAENGSQTCYLFNLAEACQRHLAEATRKNCPSRRYGIILEELRLEVHRQIGSCSQSGYSPVNMSENDQAKFSCSTEPPLNQINFTSASVEQSISLDPGNAMNYPSISDNLQPSDLTDGPFDPNTDLGILDNLEGSIWWAQLDSWAFTSLSNDPSTFTF
ncbi:hypothetical protein ASPWEDRAFT_45913 [Aspergillus wentii DTO 134E9]|uniref:Xylanolytic transcriptional activator regulatory domain-containing protein n=1 Tax=Aspergillus wentii DTO 134E9 TaxID=1073089 RepID=A0A1L9R620_ASPWE|nr:uncharacterized protein ASPWEDRAFT_45913 [Aspergillus wentii DTO 134E9]OJJ30359.1 hypothetical protein ASPWEDRAFT_45913 [Aspergillus wentii DTO 134E9]